MQVRNLEEIRTNTTKTVSQTNRIDFGLESRARASNVYELTTREWFERKNIFLIKSFVDANDHIFPFQLEYERERFIFCV